MIEWNESLSVGNSLLDGQHKRLLQIMNEFHKDVVANPENERTIIPGVLDKLFDYVQYHFETEEELMREVEFEALTAHIATHHALRDKLVDMKERLLGKEIVLSLELVVFFEEWLVEHILGTDMKYKGLL